MFDLIDFNEPNLDIELSKDLTNIFCCGPLSLFIYLSGTYFFAPEWGKSTERLLEIWMKHSIDSP